MHLLCLKARCPSRKEYFFFAILFREMWLVMVEWAHEYSLSSSLRWGKTGRKSRAEPQVPWHNSLFLKYTWQCVHAKALTELGTNIYFFKNAIPLKIQIYISMDYLYQHITKSQRQLCICYHLLLLEGSTK